VRAAVAEPALDHIAVKALTETGGRHGEPVRPISPASRAALWHHAGLERDGAGLEQLSEDEHPLVRLIAISALARTESRGAHQRRDFPERDPRFDGRHVTISAGRDPVIERWM
jgi:L-aspartate oxidase